MYSGLHPLDVHRARERPVFVVVAMPFTSKRVGDGQQRPPPANLCGCLCLSLILSPRVEQRGHPASRGEKGPRLEGAPRLSEQRHLLIGNDTAGRSFAHSRLQRGSGSQWSENALGARHSMNSAEADLVRDLFFVGVTS